MSSVTGTTLYVHPDLGRIRVPQDFVRGVSLPGAPVRRAKAGEFGLVVATQRRPVLNADGLKTRMQLIWNSVSHNERVDVGASQQDVQMFGSATSAVFKVIAVATTGFTSKTKTDLSIGVITNHATTNEFTGTGLARVAGTLGAYTGPSSLGATFTRVISTTFTASGGATAHGSALFDNVTVGSSNLFCEDSFSADATLVLNDTLTVSWSLSN